MVSYKLLSALVSSCVVVLVLGANNKGVQDLEAAATGIGGNFAYGKESVIGGPLLGGGYIGGGHQIRGPVTLLVIPIGGHGVGLKGAGLGGVGPAGFIGGDGGGLIGKGGVGLVGSHGGHFGGKEILLLEGPGLIGGDGGGLIGKGGVGLVGGHGGHFGGGARHLGKGPGLIGGHGATSILFHLQPVAAKGGFGGVGLGHTGLVGGKSGYVGRSSYW